MNFQELAENIGLEIDEYRELIELFIDTGTADFKKIQEALAGHNADQIVLSAHTIKGAAGNLGLMDVSATARTIEDNASKNRLDQLPQAVRLLKSQIDIIVGFVHG